jgi:hypothetical protein
MQANAERGVEFLLDGLVQHVVIVVIHPLPDKDVDLLRSLRCRNVELIENVLVIVEGAKAIAKALHIAGNRAAAPGQKRLSQLPIIRRDAIQRGARGILITKRHGSLQHFSQLESEKSHGGMNIL